MWNDDAVTILIQVKQQIIFNRLMDVPVLHYFSSQLVAVITRTDTLYVL